MNFQPTMILPTLLLATVAQLISAASLQKHGADNPTPKREPQILGLLDDPELNRDSCGSSLFGDRALWVCRDTQPYDENGVPTVPVYTSSASWTNIKPGGGTELRMYGDNHGKSFIPLLPGQCEYDEGGICKDGTRYPAWVNSPPLVTYNECGKTIAYSWVKNNHLKNGLDKMIKDPSVALYKLSFNWGDEGLPHVDVVDGKFWEENELPFGDYGNIIRDGIAYLWGQGDDGVVAMAKVAVPDIEDRSKYEYWVNGAWTTEKPAMGDSGVVIPNVSAGGQGTYYYSDHWKSYVWIGQEYTSNSADFYITTSPQPEGPWITPKKFFSGPNGNFTLSAYTLQAHPELSNPHVNEIYLSYTKTDIITEDEVGLYTHPLVHVEWE